MGHSSFIKGSVRHVSLGFCRYLATALLRSYICTEGRGGWDDCTWEGTDIPSVLQPQHLETWGELLNHQLSIDKWDYVWWCFPGIYAIEIAPKELLGPITTYSKWTRHFFFFLFFRRSLKNWIFHQTFKHKTRWSLSSLQNSQIISPCQE